MKRITAIFALLLGVMIAAFAASQPAWYNDVTSITANGQYYIYSVNGSGFMEAGNANVITATKSKTPSLFTITGANDGNAYSGGKYILSYQTKTCGPLGTSTSDDGATLIWTNMDNGTYWNIHGHYTAWLRERYAALYYDSNEYEATANITGGMATQTAAKYR